MTPDLVFVIPVRHPQSVPDWSSVKRDLALTLASVSAQEGTNWHCRVVANEGADLPPMPAGCELRTVDLPLPSLPDRKVDLEAYYDAIRHDKGLRILAGAEDIAPESYLMVVDFDDFVSRRLAGVVATSEGAAGWYVDRGYVWSGGNWCYLTNWFHRMCGSSHLIRRGLLGSFRLPDGTVDIAAVKRRLGSHIFNEDDLHAAGTPLAPLPFPGAVYRIGNPQSTSGTGALFRAMTPPRRFLWSPLIMLRKLRNYRRLNAELRAEFAWVIR